MRTALEQGGGPQCWARLAPSPSGRGRSSPQACSPFGHEAGKHLVREATELQDPLELCLVQVRDLVDDHQIAGHHQRAALGVLAVDREGRHSEGFGVWGFKGLGAKIKNTIVESGARTGCLRTSPTEDQLQPCRNNAQLFLAAHKSSTFCLPASVAPATSAASAPIVPVSSASRQPGHVEVHDIRLSNNISNHGAMVLGARLWCRAYSRHMPCKLLGTCVEELARLSANAKPRMCFGTFLQTSSKRRSSR